MNESIPKNVRYQTQIYPRAVVVVVIVVVPLCLRAVVVTALVSQTRGSLAFLGFGARTLVSTLGDAACPVARVKGSSKPLRRVATALEILHARRNSNDTSFCESVRSATTRRRRTRRPSSSRLFGGEQSRGWGVCGRILECLGSIRLGRGWGIN